MNLWLFVDGFGLVSFRCWFVFDFGFGCFGCFVGVMYCLLVLVVAGFGCGLVVCGLILWLFLF